MQIWQVLTLLERVEHRAAGFYNWLATVFRSDRDAAEVFATLCKQELGHVDLIRFQQRLVRNNRGAYGEVDVSQELIDDTIGRIDAFERDNPRPSLEQAVDFALSLEDDLVERLHTNAMVQANPDLAKLISGLAEADSKHAGILRELKERAAVRARA